MLEESTHILRCIFKTWKGGEEEKKKKRELRVNLALSIVY